MKSVVSRFVAIFICLAICLSFGMQCPLKASSASATFVSKAYTDKARYSPGDTVTIYTDLYNQTSSAWSGKLYLLIMHNESQVYTSSQNVSLSRGESKTVRFNWTAPSTDYQGYMVKVYISSSDYTTTAIDVSSTWTKFPRYGYVFDFGTDISQSTIDKQVDALTQDYHINALQFYDWMWRHETPIKRSDGTNIDSSWTDLFGNTVSLTTLKNYINTLHSKNGAAMAYMMSYAAREGYTDYGVNPEWGLFCDTNHRNQLNVDFNNGEYLWLFAPTSKSWQNFISNAYIDSINSLDFDGIQMDQMGQRDNVYDYYGNRYSLDTSFSSLINAVKTKLNSNNSNKSYITFNIVDGTVDGWALRDVRQNANTDFNFSEIWWLSNNYNDIRNYIEQLKSNGKATVLAAYMNYKNNSGIRYEAENASFSGVDVETNHPGYTGTGFLENFAQVGDYVEFTVNVPESMTYPLVFQYGDNSDEATRNIYVDGKYIGQVGFHPQGTWDKFVFDAYINTYLTAGTHKIKVAYGSNNTGAINLDSLTLSEFDENSVRLADATFAASGATHIELGAGLDDVTMLPSEYYRNTSKAMSSSLKSAMKQYYNFITAYENLLYDSDINYTDQGNQFINIDGQSISGNGATGTIWHISRETDDYDILHLINLTSETDAEWRNTTFEPSEKDNLRVKYYLSSDASISGVYLASPDSNDGLSTPLTYTTGTDNVGHYVSFVVPSLKYWDMIYIRRSIATPSNQVYEAEDAIKTNVGVNTDHPGYTGNGFVDSFAESGDEVTFQVVLPEAGDKTLLFRYSNNTGYTSTRHVYIDGSYAGTLSMPNLGSWDKWSTASLNTTLTEGVHFVCVYYDTSDDHAINLDNLTIS